MNNCNLTNCRYNKDNKCVTVCTRDENGTQIEMTRHTDKLK